MQGFTKSLLDQSAHVGAQGEQQQQQQQPTQKQMASSTGYVTGFILCAFLLAKLSRFFLLLIATLRFDKDESKKSKIRLRDTAKRDHATYSSTFLTYLYKYVPYAMRKITAPLW